MLETDNGLPAWLTLQPPFISDSVKQQAEKSVHSGAREQTVVGTMC